MLQVSDHLDTVEADKYKSKTQIKQLTEENTWLRNELEIVLNKLQVSILHMN